jgi:lipopolysaccharide/colanic/teichoic acid biosynthesis glycosyltransferase
MITAAGDTRVTALGRILRKTKLDELPSLWNVIKGDMSLVGPRPEVPQYVDINSPDWKLVLEVRPGITDPVTANLRDEETLLAEVTNNPETFYRDTLQKYKLQGYLEYLSARNCWTDLRVLARTCALVIVPFMSRASAATDLLHVKGRE